jgi:hypothetical protein
MEEQKPPQENKRSGVVEQLAKEAKTNGTETTKKNISVVSELTQFTQTAKKFKLGDVVVPILSIIILILLTLFVYIPQITNAIEANKEAKEVSENIDSLEKLNTDLDSVDISQLQIDLSDAQIVIPYELQVSDFVFYVDTLARKEGLNFKEIFAGDVEVKGGGVVEDSVISGVSGPLRYTGSLEDITTFLDELQNASPFIVSTDKVDIKNIADSSSWEVSITLTGYYVDRANIASANIYNPFVIYTRYDDVIEVFKDKAAIIEAD